jgi:hypothetical protein
MQTVVFEECYQMCKIITRGTRNFSLRSGALASRLSPRFPIGDGGRGGGAELVKKIFFFETNEIINHLITFCGADISPCCKGRQLTIKETFIYNSYFFYEKNRVNQEVLLHISTALLYIY